MSGVAWAGMPDDIGAATEPSGGADLMTGIRHAGPAWPGRSGPPAMAGRFLPDPKRWAAKPRSAGSCRPWQRDACRKRRSLPRGLGRSADSRTWPDFAPGPPRPQSERATTARSGRSPRGIHRAARPRAAVPPNPAGAAASSCRAGAACRTSPAQEPEVRSPGPGQGPRKQRPTARCPRRDHRSPWRRHGGAPVRSVRAARRHRWLPWPWTSCAAAAPGGCAICGR
jgi:hypothetical protein